MICLVLGGLACGWWPFCDIWTPFGFCVLFAFGLFSFVIVVVILINFFWRPFCGKAAILFCVFSLFSLLLLWCFVLVPIYLTFIAVF